jgi:hypothetical protein
MDSISFLASSNVAVRGCSIFVTWKIWNPNPVGIIFVQSPDLSAKISFAAN